ncbi:hypothetical protein MMC30_001723 [Trapelia coarctata]|nr:hypothetical protein [Trapelia coarctata]
MSAPRLFGAESTALKTGLLDDRLVGLPPSFKADYYYTSGVDINWTYIIDLDNEVFSVCNGLHYKLSQVPRNLSDEWKDFVAMERYSPLDTILNVVLELKSKCEVPSSISKYRFRIVLAKNIHHFDKRSRHGPLLVSTLWKQSQKLHGMALGNYLCTWKPTDFAFREYAHAILCLASRSPQSVRILDSRTPAGLQADLAKAGLALLTAMNRKLIEIISDFGVSCHAEGIEPGSAPATSIFWFEGVLVVLVAELPRGGDKTLFEEGIAKILETARREGRSHFNAVMLSIEDVIILRVYSNGYVEHTETYNLINYTALNFWKSFTFHILNNQSVLKGERSINDEPELPGRIQN